MSTDLRQYYPVLYDGFIEIDAITEIENAEFDRLSDEMQKDFRNQFVLTADENGVQNFEKVLDIMPNPTAETLDFRKERIINRFSMRSPLSMQFLRQKLDAIIGLGQYSIYMDYNNYALYIESSADNQGWFEEIYITINSIKPANIVFVNKPLNVDTMHLSEQINAVTIQYNYRLGISWALGQKQFADLENEGVYKLPETTSLQQELFNKVANFTASEITKVRINNQTDITDFSMKGSSNNTVMIEYTVPKTNGVNEITNVKLLGADNSVLSSAVVYIPLLDDVLMKHHIKVKEGI